MKCPLFYHLKQRIYLAEIKNECFEAMRLKHELDVHLDACPICAGLNVDFLASELFGAGVVVIHDNDHQ